MSYYGIYSERNQAIIRSLCVGNSTPAVSKEIGLSTSRIHQIASKHNRILRSLIQQINKRIVKHPDDLLLSHFLDIHSFPPAQRFPRFRELHLGLLDCLSSGSVGLDMEELHRKFKAYQVINIAHLTESDEAVAKAILWGQSIDQAAEETKRIRADIFYTLLLVCYRNNPQCMALEYFWPSEVITHLQQHKRDFFDPIEIDFTNLKYLSQLNTPVEE